MGCSIASDFWLSDRISSWISKVLFVTRMSSEEDSRWFPTTLSWRRSRKSSKGTQRQARMCELLVRGLFVGLVSPETLAEEMTEWLTSHSSGRTKARH